MDLHFDLIAPYEEMANVLFQSGFVQRRRACRCLLRD